MKKFFYSFATLTALVMTLFYGAALPTAKAATATTDFYGAFGATPVIQYALSNVLCILGTDYTNVGATYANPIIKVPSGRGMAFSAVYNGNKSTNTVGYFGFGFAVSTDGTNYCTVTNKLLWVYEPALGTTTGYGWTNIPATYLDNARYIKLYQITNGNIGVIYTNCFVSNIVVTYTPPN